MEKKFEHSQRMLKDATDTITILEITWNDKSIELDKLNAEIVNVKQQGFSCTLCEYKCELEVDIRKHIHKNHEQVSEMPNEKCTHNDENISSTSHYGSCKYLSESNNYMKLHVNYFNHF